MRRRTFLGKAAAAAALVPLGAAAQSRLPVVGYLSSTSPEAEAPIRAAFLEGLQKAGLVVGRDVAIEYRFAAGSYDRLPVLAAELVHLPVAVLVATGVPAAVAAQKATEAVPIVFSSGFDPVELGLAASLNRPGGNATGVSVFTTKLGPKRLELLREILPQSGLTAALFGPTTATTQLQIREVEAAAQALSQPVLVLQASDASEAEAAFTTMRERRVSGLVYGASLYFQVIADKLVALAARYRVPAVYEWPEFVAAGGLISYSTSRAETGQLTGGYVGRILKGAAPSDLPVVQSSRFELAINLNTARDLGLTIPPTLLARADAVIE